MIELIIKNRFFLFGCLLTIILVKINESGYKDIILLYLYPIFLSFIFLIYSESRNSKLKFSNKISSINKYFIYDYYVGNTCFNGCNVYYDINDFINEFQCYDLIKSDKVLYNDIKIFIDTYGTKIKKIQYVNPVGKFILSDINQYEFRRTLSKIRIKINDRS